MHCGHILRSSEWWRRRAPGQQLPLQRSNRRLGLLDLICQHLQYLPRHSRQARITIIADNGDQLAYIAHKTNPVSQRLASIPGIGPIIATAIASTVADLVHPRGFF
jgi:transposase